MSKTLLKSLREFGNSFFLNFQTKDDIFETILLNRKLPVGRISSQPEENLNTYSSGQSSTSGLMRIDEA